MDEVTMFTDGAVSVHKTQQGGWCAVLFVNRCVANYYFSEKIERYGIVLSPTKINRVELTAVLEGLKCLGSPSNVTIHTDSQNVIGWLYGFDLLTCTPQDRKWKRRDTECSNLCAEIEEVIARGGHTVKWVKVAGHSGNSGNERCDYVANALSQGKEVEAEELLPF
jgi:ribonuclease HI